MRVVRPVHFPMLYGIVSWYEQLGSVYLTQETNEMVLMAVAHSGFN